MLSTDTQTPTHAYTEREREREERERAIVLDVIFIACRDALVAVPSYDRFTPRKHRADTGKARTPQSAAFTTVKLMRKDRDASNRAFEKFQQQQQQQQRAQQEKEKTQRSIQSAPVRTVKVFS